MKRRRDSGKFSVKDLKPVCVSLSFVMAYHSCTGFFLKADLSQYEIPVVKNLRFGVEGSVSAKSAYKHVLSIAV